MFKLIRQSVLSTLCLAVLLCAAYPLLVTGVANAFFPKEAAGSLILRGGAVLGPAPHGPPVSCAEYFHPRPPPPAGTDSQGRAVGNDFTADVRVRRAINRGIDRQEMIDHVLNGYGSPAYSVCDNLPWYNPASEVSYDPEGAAAPSGS